jgi:PEP-CTERM motif-containing protein
MMARPTRILIANILAAAALLVPTTVRALALGSAYFVSEAESQNAAIGFAHGTPNATFTVPTPLNFTSAGGYTLSAFLASSPGEITLTGTAADLARNLDVGFSGTMIEFTGTVTVTNGQTFTVTHDDGLQLEIGGLLVVDHPGPTAPTTSTDTYTGPSGNFAFDLVYGECCGPPAVLNISLPLVSVVTPVPEPGSLVLLGSALAGLGFGAVLRRRKTG